MPSLSPSSSCSFWRRPALRLRASARSVSVAFAICVDVTALHTGAMHVSTLHTMHLGCLCLASGQPGLGTFHQRIPLQDGSQGRQRLQYPVQDMVLVAAATDGQQSVSGIHLGAGPSRAGGGEAQMSPSKPAPMV